MSYRIHSLKMYVSTLEDEALREILTILIEEIEELQDAAGSNR